MKRQSAGASRQCVRGRTAGGDQQPQTSVGIVDLSRGVNLPSPGGVRPTPSVPIAEEAAKGQGSLPSSGHGNGEQKQRNVEQGLRNKSVNVSKHCQAGESGAQAVDITPGDAQECTTTNAGSDGLATGASPSSCHPVSIAPVYCCRQRLCVNQLACVASIKDGEKPGASIDLPQGAGCGGAPEKEEHITKDVSRVEGGGDSSRARTGGSLTAGVPMDLPASPSRRKEWAVKGAVSWEMECTSTETALPGMDIGQPPMIPSPAEVVEEVTGSSGLLGQGEGKPRPRKEEDPMIDQDGQEIPRGARPRGSGLPRYGKRLRFPFWRIFSMHLFPEYNEDEILDLQTWAEVHTLAEGEQEQQGDQPIKEASSGEQEHPAEIPLRDAIQLLNKAILVDYGQDEASSESEASEQEEQILTTDSQDSQAKKLPSYSSARMRCLLGGLGVTALVDTGADVSCIPEALVRQFPNRFQYLDGYATKVIKGVSQHALHILGVVKSQVKIGSRQYPIYLWVVRGLKQQLVLGTDTLYTARAIVDIYNGYLYHGPKKEAVPIDIKIRGVREHSTSPYLVMATESMAIDGNHGDHVPVKLSPQPPSQVRLSIEPYFVTERLGLVVQPGVWEHVPEKAAISPTFKLRVSNLDDSVTAVVAGDVLAVTELDFDVLREFELEALDRKHRKGVANKVDFRAIIAALEEELTGQQSPLREEKPKDDGAAIKDPPGEPPPPKPPPGSAEPFKAELPREFRKDGVKEEIKDHLFFGIKLADLTEEDVERIAQH